MFTLNTVQVSWIFIGILIIALILILITFIKGLSDKSVETEIYDLLEERYGVYDLEETTSGALILRTYNIGEDKEIDSWSEKLFESEDELYEYLTK